MLGHENKIHQQGLTLIEMMIAMVIGLIITGMLMTMFISNIRSNRDSVAMIRLNQELRGVMTFVSRELKRAGYSAGSFDTYMNELKITDVDNDTISDNNCITYSYDETGDSAISVVPTTAKFGFRLNSATNEIKWGSNATLTCQFGSAITEPKIAKITMFEIKLTKMATGIVTINQIDVTITGEASLSDNTTASRTISEVIRVRNDAL